MKRYIVPDRLIGRRDLTGLRFGSLRVLDREPSENGRIVWLCECDCGQLAVVIAGNLRSGRTQSCGCRAGMAAITHGLSTSREYRVYYNMLARCYDRTNKAFHRYGGRGITVCNEWRDSFEAFIEDMGKCPPGLTIERRDNDAEYSKENCYWATRWEQAQNRDSKFGR